MSVRAEWQFSFFDFTFIVSGTGTPMSGSHVVLACVLAAVGALGAFARDVCGEFMNWFGLGGYARLLSKQLSAVDPGMG